MFQEILRLAFIVIYTSSSLVGTAMFIYMWVLTHADSVALRANMPADAEEARLRTWIARRNELVAGILSVTFCLYGVAGIITMIWLFEVAALPWLEGIVVFPLLVFCNFLEMLIGVGLLVARSNMNRERN